MVTDIILHVLENAANLSRYDYDEKAGEEVSIKDLVWELRRAV